MDGSYFHHHLQPFCLLRPLQVKNESLNKEIKGESEEPRATRHPRRSLLKFQLLMKEGKTVPISSIVFNCLFLGNMFKKSATRRR